MKDFAKIFIVLCLTVAAFMYGRNYGEATYRETDEYKELIKAKENLSFANAELENVKVKFQNIINSSENKKQDELLAQILQVFLADLGLRAAPIKSAVAKPTELSSEKNLLKEQKKFNIKKLKSYEWILANSTDTNEIQKNLKNVEIKNLNTFLADARQPAITEFEPIFGTYRGRIRGVDNKEYGSMLIEINAIQQNEKIVAKGEIKIFKENRETMGQGFSTNTLGLSVDGSTSFIINPGNDNKFYQLYKLKETQQLAGFFYERLVNGTTKTIGSFVLNRTDQF